MKILLLYALFILKWLKPSIITTRAVPRLGGIPDSPSGNYLPTELINGCKRFHKEIFSGEADQDVTYISLISKKSEGEEGVNTFYAFIKKDTLFIELPDDCKWYFQESISSLLELAENILNCEKVVICIKKNKENIKILLRSFMYIGFQLVCPSYLKNNTNYQLVGYQL